MKTQEWFKTNKLSPEDLKKKFSEVDGTGNPTDAKLKPLVDRIHQRVIDGMTSNLAESRVWWAIDKAYDAPFQQISPTLLESLMDRDVSNEKVLSVINDWGFSHLISNMDCGCGSTCGTCKGKKSLNLPVFFKVFVPLVKSYVTIRWSKIYGDRNIFPLFKYEPLKNTALNRMRCELITDRVQVMSEQYGYNTALRQEIFYALLYSFSLSFPKEHWHEKKTKSEGKEKILKEGIRYEIPHPSRVYYDCSERLSSFNTDTGARFGGYWSIRPFGDIKKNTAYWNTDKISYGENWGTRFPSYFEEIWPCSLKFPAPGDATGSMASGERTHQRDEKLSSFYTTTDDDKATTLVEHFELVNPSEYGISDVDEEIWFRFVVASETTVVYAEPMSYPPIIYTGYDYDENRRRNASLGLEVMPFQDHIGNLLTQYILSVKENLNKVVFFDEDMVDKKHIDSMRNLGEKKYRSTVYIPMSGKEFKFSQNDPRMAFQPITFPNQNTQEISTAISSIVNILERLLGMSAQELGQPASHEQSATETQIISNNTTTRLNLTSSFVDDAITARKRQLYAALMANGSEEIYSQIENPTPYRKNLLKALGFTVVSDGDSSNDGSPLLPEEVQIVEVAEVEGKKSALMLEGFASNREGENRINGPAVAAAMTNALSLITSNPMLFEAVGVEQIIKTFNMISQVAGLPKDFKLIPAGQQQMNQQVQALAEQLGKVVEQVPQLVQQSQQEVIEQVGQALQPLNEAVQQMSATDAEQTRSIEQIIQTMTGAVQQAPPAPVIQ